jgi:hypothetical protein
MSIIIINRSVIQKKAATDPANYDHLPPDVKDRIDFIAVKAFADWTREDRLFMASVPLLAQMLNDV